ncbi:MAG: hypothetical protein UHZ06_02530 [Paludibacteraceae bacterium]|nr:hypothetical protein [Paludibacteraceae bacterium]
MEKQAAWQSAINKVFWGYLAYVLCNSILCNFFGFIPVLPIILSIGAIAAIVFYCMGIIGMKNVCEGTTWASGTKKLFISVILLAVGLLFDFIPLMGWVTTILNIVAFVFTFLGYNELRKVTEDENLAAGAKLLWISAIICLATSFFGFIPLVGAIILGIAGIADFVLSFLGWKKISNSKFNPGQLA